LLTCASWAHLAHVLQRQAPPLESGKSVQSTIFEAYTSSGSFVVTTSWIWLAWLVLELLTMLTNPQRRALHDFIAGTVVVRTNVEPVEASPRASDASVGSG
jgi:hypothetical protein